MPMTLRFRISGPRTARDRVLERLRGTEGVTRVEGVAETTTYLDESDTSSAGMAEERTADSFGIEVEVDTEETADRIQRLAETEARNAEAVIEIIEPF